MAISWDPILSRQILTDLQLAALGAVVAESTYLERALELVIGHLLRADKSTREAILGRAMIGTKIQLLADLAPRRLRSAKRKRDFAAIISRISACNGDRVTAVHGAWWWWEKQDDARPHTGSAKAVHRPGRSMSALNLEKLAQRISTVHGELLEFYGETWLPQTLRRTGKRLGSAMLRDIGL